MLVKILWGITIPRTPVCEGHSSPFDAFAEAYFAEAPISVWKGSRGFAGKCVDAMDLIPLADGRLIPAKQLLDEPNLHLIDMDGFAVEATATDNGYDLIYRVEHESGVLHRTGHHGIYSAEQTRKQKILIPLKDEFRNVEVLNSDTHLILVSDRTPAPNATRGEPPEELRLMGYLLGDGSVSTKTIMLSATNPEIIADALTCAQKIGVDAWYSDRFRRINFRGRRIRELLEKYEMAGARSEAKHLAPWIWELDAYSLQQIAIGLLSTDGYISSRSVVFQVVSSQLRDDFARLMFRLGLPGLTTNRGPGSYKKNGQKIICQDRYQWRIFEFACGYFREVFANLVGKTDQVESLHPRRGQRWRTRNAPEGFHWEKIRSITTMGERSTVCISVPDHHKFLTPVLEHNSFTLALLALTEAVTLGCEVSVLGGSGEQSERVLAHMEHFWQSDGAPVYLQAKNPSRRLTRLTNGAKISAQAASQKSVRGAHGARLRSDEIDEMEIEILDAALGQTMAVPDPAGGILVRAQTVLSSTHQYSDGTFSKILKRASERGYPFHEWCFRETEKPYGWLESSEIERKKHEVSDHVWQTEFVGQEPNPEGRAFMPESVQLMFDKNLGTMKGMNREYREFEAPQPEGRYATGADWAKAQDFTVIVTIRTDVEPCQVVAFERLGRMPWPRMIERFDARVSRYPGSACHDATGGGNIVADLMKHNAIDFDMRGRRRDDLLGNYISAVESGRVQSPMIEYMHNEHRFASNNDFYGSGHLPDTCSAMALAWHARSMRTRTRAYVLG